MILGVLESQMPWHRPERGHIPAYHSEWLGRYRHGDDLTIARDLAAPLDWA